MRATKVGALWAVLRPSLLIILIYFVSGEYLLTDRRNDFQIGPSPIINPSLVQPTIDGTMPRANQHKPCPPEDVIQEALTFYYHLGLTDGQIAENCKDHYDQDIYGMGKSSVKRLRKKWGLLSTRQQHHSQESIMALIAEIRQSFPMRGAEMLRKQLRMEHDIRIPRETISKYLKIMEPHAVNQRRARRFKRKRFYAAGVNDVWAQDQHDKWGPRFGLWLHNSIDPFTGFNNWLKVWWTNSNPRLIGGYYINAVRDLKAVPLTTQSDPGSENYGIANIHTLIRHELDPSLGNTLQHIFKHKKTNVKSEANWSIFRRDFALGYEDLFQYGVDRGWYNVNNTLENLVFRWLAIPWLQTKLDEWVLLRNRSAPRANKHKILPHGIPIMIREKPEHFDTCDFKIPVPMEILDRLEQTYAPPDHPVFQLTPPEFDQRANEHYNALGRPAVSYTSFWDVYRQLMARFHQNRGTEEENLASVILAHQDTVQRVSEDQESFALLPGMQELREGGARVQPADVSDGLEYADFTETEESEEGD